MMQQGMGLVQGAEVKNSTNGSYSRININGSWYSAFDGGQLAQMMGATVTFQFDIEQRNGKNYQTIRVWDGNGRHWQSARKGGGGATGGGQGSGQRASGGSVGAPAMAPAAGKSQTEVLLEFASPILAAYLSAGNSIDHLNEAAQKVRAAAGVLTARPADQRAPQPMQTPVNQQTGLYREPVPGADFDDDIPF